MTFDDMYEGTPPWDIGRPQPELVDLVASGALRGRVLDVGCGTGENSLEFARRGYDTWGVDSSPKALAKANAKGAERHLAVHFVLADALDLSRLGQTFDTVVDCGLFHVFDDAERARYVLSLGTVVRPGGRYFTLVFSDEEPADWGGPRRIRREEFAQSFAQGWVVDDVRAARFATRMPEVTGKAWLASLTRT